VTSGTDERRRTIRVLGVAVVLVGALLVLAAFRFLDWYDVPARTADSAGNVTFGKLRASTDQLTGTGLAGAYFDWLAWVLLIALIITGVAANLATPISDPLRVAGFVLGLLGAIATYYALHQHFRATASHHGVFYNSTWGLWAAIGGFLLAAAGAVLGPRKLR
jgi:hypothetical protein